MESLWLDGGNFGVTPYAVTLREMEMWPQKRVAVGER